MYIKKEIEIALTTTTNAVFRVTDIDPAWYGVVRLDKREYCSLIPTLALLKVL